MSAATRAAAIAIAAIITGSTIAVLGIRELRFRIRYNRAIRDLAGEQEEPTCKS